MTDRALAHARAYIEAGWSLCAIEPRSKKASGKGWQTKGRPAEHWQAHPEDGMGLVHGLSGTCSLDLDWMEAAEIALPAVGVDVRALLGADDAVRLIGAPGRGKLLYRVPEGAELSRYSLNWPDPETGKPRAVLELRGGPVQDVLPPSIHPDTGEPYRWEGDWRALPELPEELLQVWEHWSEARKDMEAACPWNDQPGAAAKRYEGVTRRTYGEGESVIAAFNEAHSLRPILESFGYLKAGPRYISPHSTTGTPGVVFLPGSEGRLIYVHHASDPLGDGHSHDAFSVWCQLEHGGDVTRAVRTAAEMLGISHGQRENKEGAEIAARIMGGGVRVPPPPERSAVETVEPPAAPTEPIPIPALADLEYWLRARNRGAKRTATIQGALAFAAAMTMRRYATWNGDPTNVLLGVVDRSIAGLRPMKGALQVAAIAARERPMVRGTKLSSDATLHRALHEHPRMFWVSDDYGYMVNMSRRQPSGAIESVLGVIQTAYLGDIIPLDRDTIGGKRDIPLSECVIHDPGIVMLALVSEDQMREITRPGEYGRGSVQQVFFARADEFADEEAGRSRRSDPVPESVIELVEEMRLIEQKVLGAVQTLATHEAKPIPVELGVGVRDAMIEIETALSVAFQDERLSSWRGIKYGALATIERLAASLAAWANPHEPLVTVDVVRWLGRWVGHHVSRMAEWYDVVATDDGETNHVSEIRKRLVQDGRSKGLTLREIARKYHRFMELSKSQQEEILMNMAEAGYCRIDDSGKSARYIDASFLAPSPQSADA